MLKATNDQAVLDKALFEIAKKLIAKKFTSIKNFEKPAKSEPTKGLEDVHSMLVSSAPAMIAGYEDEIEGALELWEELSSPEGIELYKDVLEDAAIGLNVT